MRTLTVIIAAVLLGACTIYFGEGDDHPPDPYGPDADHPWPDGGYEPGGDAGYDVDGGFPWPDAGYPWPDGGDEPWPDAAPPDDGGHCGIPDASPHWPDGDPDVDAAY